MTMLRTQEQKELEKVFEPYMDGNELRKDAPPEAVKARQRYSEIWKQRREAEIASWFE